MAKMKRYHESAGMKSAMKKAGNMINEDKSAACLLPTHVIEKEFGSAPNYNQGYMDDLYAGVTKQLKEEAAGFKKETKPGKY